MIAYDSTIDILFLPGKHHPIANQRPWQSITPITQPEYTRSSPLHISDNPTKEEIRELVDYAGYLAYSLMNADIIEYPKTVFKVTLKDFGGNGIFDMTMNTVYGVQVANDCEVYYDDGTPIPGSPFSQDPSVQLPGGAGKELTVIIGNKVTEVEVGMITSIEMIEYGRLERLTFKNPNDIVSFKTTEARNRLRELPEVIAKIPGLTEFPYMYTGKMTEMSFDAGADLTTIPELDFSSLTDFNAMFRGCANLVNIPTIDYSKATTVSAIFEGCTSLVSLGKSGDVIDFSNLSGTSRALLKAVLLLHNHQQQEHLSGMVMMLHQEYM